MQTDAKQAWNAFSERRSGGVRYFVGGDGPPLLLVHGLGGMASNWRLVAPALAEERLVIVPELPGHGGSTAVDASPSLDPFSLDPFSLDPFADAILAVAEAEGALPAPWVGHSLGGLVGLRAAVRRPDAVTGIVLAAGAGISSATRLGEAVVTTLGTLKPGRFVGKRARAVSRSRLGRTLTFGWWGVADPAGFDPEMAEAFLLGPTQHSDTLTAGRALVATDARADLDRVRCPCLCLWGTDDHWVPLQDGMEYARRLRAPLRTIADCGHLLIGERPDAVVRAVREFVTALDAA